MQFAKKKYGQHFLINQNVVEQIASYINALAQKHTKNVLEVGPGKGVLTQELVKYDLNLKAVEIDQDMVDHLLQAKILTEEALIRQNFLKLDLDDLFGGEEFLLVGNFPYNISSQIVIKMLEEYSRIPAMLGMFQREMAERIIEPKGSKVYGRLSVLTQCKYIGKKMVKISPGSFNPPPKVDSMVIQLERKEVVDTIYTKKLFKTIVHLSFGQRRKMLRNTLKGLVKEKALLEESIFTERPEQLSIEQFAYLTELIEKQEI